MDIDTRDPLTQHQINGLYGRRCAVDEETGYVQPQSHQLDDNGNDTFEVRFDESPELRRVIYDDMEFEERS